MTSSVLLAQIASHIDDVWPFIGLNVEMCLNDPSRNTNRHMAHGKSQLIETTRNHKLAKLKRKQNIKHFTSGRNLSQNAKIAMRTFCVAVRDAYSASPAIHSQNAMDTVPDTTQFSAKDKTMQIAVGRCKISVSCTPLIGSRYLLRTWTMTHNGISAN